LNDQHLSLGGVGESVTYWKALFASSLDCSAWIKEVQQYTWHEIRCKISMDTAYLFEIFHFQVGVQFFNKVPFLKAIAEIDFLPNRTIDVGGEE
jgi:hypothetical protein